MPSQKGVVATAHASRYLQQLSKHWGHKFAVTFDPTTSRIEMDKGRVLTMAATDSVLNLDVSAPDDDTLTHFKTVVEDHVRRFAFREELAFEWG